MRSFLLKISDGWLLTEAKSRCFLIYQDHQVHNIPEPTTD